MLDRSEVRANVGRVLRGLVIKWTPFTAQDPDASEHGFQWNIVPSKDLWKGFGADRAAWLVLLIKVESGLHQENSAYDVLVVSEADADKTLREPLHNTAEHLTGRIMEAAKLVA